MDLELNREPAEAEEGESLGHLLVELEDYHGRIEERIRLLESVVARARQRVSLQSSSAASISSSAISSTTDSNINNIVGISRTTGQPQPQPQPQPLDDGSIKKPCKILLAEALAMDAPCQQNVPYTSTSTSSSCKSGGTVFDCNICFSLAKDPVLTCCGHLFCWPCFYCLPNSDSDSSRECPVCQGEVLDTDTTPIYGCGSASDPFDSKDPSPFKIPPRPRARRIDRASHRLAYPTLSPSRNYQRFTQIFRAVPTLPTQERIRQLTTRVHPTRQVTSNTPAAQVVIPPSPGPGSSHVAHNPPIQPHRFSRLLSQAGISPMAMNSAEMLPQHGESHVNRQQVPRTQIQPLSVHDDDDDNDNGRDRSSTSILSVRQDDPSMNPATEMNSMASHYSSLPSSQNAHSGNPVTNRINSSYQTARHRSSSSRRRTSNGIGLTVRSWQRRGDWLSS